MKGFNYLLVLFLLGCGDLGSSKTESTNNQLFNPEPQNCQVTCFSNPDTGEISVSANCEGGVLTPIIAPSVDQCTSFIELPSEAAESEETA